MDIQGIGMAIKTAKKHPNLRKPIAGWQQKTESVLWTSPVDRKETFPTVDFIPARNAYTFEIGDSYRLAAAVTFCRVELPQGLVTIMDIMDHDEYMKWSHAKRGR